MSDIIKLSVSKSATFRSCKKKYQFAYVYKLPRKEWQYYVFGRFVHRVLELFHLARLNGSTASDEQLMTNSFNDSLAEFKDKIDKNSRTEAVEVLSGYLIQNKLNQNFSLLDVEKTFNVKINDAVILTGMIDRIQLDNDGVYHVIDYKTSKSKAYLKDDTLQLLTYAYVLLQEHPEINKIRVSYIMLRHNSEFLTKEFTRQEILSIKDIYENYASEINSETEFLPTTSKLCKYCEFLSSCPAGLETIKNDFNHGKISWKS